MRIDSRGDILIRDFRCCMCPQVNQNKRICAGVPGSAHPHDTICDFVVRYRDARGWTYFVRGGLQDQYKTFVKKDPTKPAGIGEHAYRGLPWRETFDKAQEDLNRLAQAKGWEVFKPERGMGS